jgi:large subunit ribosomal protein L16
MLMPKRVKYRKVHRGRRTGKATGSYKIDFGEFGLQAMGACWLTNRQIEASRIAMTRYIRRGGKVWIRVFPDKPYTKKPAETRMGSGKGNPEGWVAVVKPGRILFEMSGVPEVTAREAIRRAIHKLPIRARFVTRRDFAKLYEEMGGEPELIMPKEGEEMDTEIHLEAGEHDTVAVAAPTEEKVPPPEAGGEA